MVNVVGLYKTAAEEELKKAGFTAYTIETATDDKVEEGYVISQSVDEGTAIPADEKIVITISEGKEDVEVPDVRGYSDDQATTLLTEAGFLHRFSFRRLTDNLIFLYRIIACKQ